MESIEPEIDWKDDNEYEEVWHNEDGEIHRDGDKPARIAYFLVDDKPVIVAETWMQHGEIHRDGDKPAKICRTIDGNRTVMSWFQHGKYHREGDKPAYVSETPKRRVSAWYKNSFFSRADGKPTKICESISTGKVILEAWLDKHGRYEVRKNGKPNRITYYEDGTLRSEKWANKKGQVYRRKGKKPSIVLYDETGYAYEKVRIGHAPNN